MVTELKYEKDRKRVYLRDDFGRIMEDTEGDTVRAIQNAKTILIYPKNDYIDVDDIIDSLDILKAHLIHEKRLEEKKRELEESNEKK